MATLRKFITAANGGDLELVKSLLQNDSEILDGVNSEGNTALICACASGQERVVRCLLEKGAKLNKGNHYGWTALMAASYWGHESIVSILLQNNCNPKFTNRYDCTPLSCAARRNHIQVAVLLITNGAEVNGTSNDHNPLMTAVQHGHDSMVELLLDKGANVNYKDPKTGWSPLMLAALNGHRTAVQILIKNGANCNEVNKLDKTALEIAKKRKRKDVENVLDRVTTLRVRDAGNLLVDINIVEAARKGNLERIKELSKTTNFNVNETDGDGVSPLMCAAASNHYEVVKFLVEEQNADVNLQDKTNGWTALIYATNYTHKSIIYFLILRGADVHLKTFSSHTAFELALYNGQTDIIRVMAGGTGSTSKINLLQKRLKEALSAEKKSATMKNNSNNMQVSEISDANKQLGLKVLVSKGLNKLWNHTARGLNKRQTAKARPFQANLNDASIRINVDSVKNSNILSGNSITSGELSTNSAVLKSAMIEGIGQKKVTHLPLAGPSSNLWTNDLSDPVVPPFTPTTVLDFNTIPRDSVETLSTSPQVPVVILNGSVYKELKEENLSKTNRLNHKLIPDSGFYSFHAKNNGQRSQASNNQDEQSPESSFSFCNNSPNSSFTDSTNTSGIPCRKQGWSPVNVPSQSRQNYRKLQVTSLPSCSPPSITSTSPTYHYLVPKTMPTKQKSNSLPRIGRSSVVPLHNPQGSVKSEPDDEEMKRLLEKLSLEKYSPIFEEHEVDIESFVTLNNADLDEIGIDQDDAKEQILAVVQQLRKQKEKKQVFLQTEAWS